MFLILASSFCLGDETKIVFIVNKSNPVSSLSKKQISDYFLKKNRTWKDGEPVRFFDHADGSKIKIKFLSTILQRSSREVDSYWIGQKLYSGDSAPVQVESDQMIINLISRFPGAIGYVEALTVEESAVKVIEVEDGTL